MSQIIKTGHVERAALGVRCATPALTTRRTSASRRSRGMLVQDFGDATSPAAKAGIQAGDVIIAVDGKRVDYVAQLQEAIAFRKPGDVATSRSLARAASTRRSALRSSAPAATAETHASNDDERQGRRQGLVDAEARRLVSRRWMRQPRGSSSCPPT